MTAVLTFWRLGTPALWADELATNGAATLSWRALWQLSKSVDIVLLPYYAFMHVWVRVVGDSDLILRVPSAIAVTAAVGLTALIGARLFDRTTGFIAAMLLAVTPATSRAGQEARPYAAAMFFAVLATYLLIRIAEEPSRRRSLGYSLSLATACLLHAVTGLIVVSHAIFAPHGRDHDREPGRGSGRHWRNWALCAGPALLPGVALFVWEMFREKSTTAWIPRLTVAQAISRTPTVAESATVGAALLALCIVALNRRRNTVALACWALVPTAAVLIAGFWEPIWVSKYLWFTLPGVALLAASGIRRIPVGPKIAIVLVIAILGSTAQLTMRGPAGHAEDSRAVDSIIGPRYQPGDVAVYANNHPSIPWAPRDMVARYLPAARTPEDVLAITAQREDGQLLATERTGVAGCLGDVTRVWVIRADNPANPISGLDGTKTAYLERDFRILQTWRRPLLTIVLLTRKVPGTAPAC